MGNIKERVEQLQEPRLEFCKKQIIKLGYEIIDETETSISFMFKGQKITHFPYTGWHSGKGIKPGRGIIELLKQIK